MSDGFAPKQENWLSRVARQVPGFRGYFEREDRRAADEAQRRALAERLHRSGAALGGLSQRWLAAGAIDALPLVDALRRRLDVLINRLGNAPRGYSAFFDRQQIDAARLEAVYQYDSELLWDVELLAKKIEEAVSSAAAADAPSLFNELTAAVAVVEERVAGRENVLRDL